jgi:hypothetical protein
VTVETKGILQRRKKNDKQIEAVLSIIKDLAAADFKNTTRFINPFLIMKKKRHNL